MKQVIIKRATEDFIRYGFKSFTMDDLANELGMSKKTLYEYYKSKNDLVEACLESFLADFDENMCCLIKGEGNIIQNIFRGNQETIEKYKITSTRPLWELKKYYPKQHEKFQTQFYKKDNEFIDNILNQGISEGLFRENIDREFVKAFFYGMNRMKEDPEIFPETKFDFKTIIQTKFEYLIRILANENGLKELEKVLAK